MTSESTNVLNSFEPIDLSQMDRVELMSRIDSKYVFHVDQLAYILEEIEQFYKVLVVNENRISRYESLYFDTPNFDLYQYHHSGKLNRFKFRIRKYVESNLSFFEVKFKNNKRRTNKKRIQNFEFEIDSNKDVQQFLDENSSYKFQELEEKIWVNYSRITLVNKNINERVTLDLNLTFVHNEHTKTMDQIVIAEVKQKRSVISPFIKLMQNEHIREGSISKYCLGVMNLHEDIKSNNFKRFQLAIEKIANKE
jgi:hypothetical protein